jgi:hypothetical protein
VLVRETNRVYLEGRVQLKHFDKKPSIKHILCSQSNDGAAFIPYSETSFCRFKNGGLIKAGKKISLHTHPRLNVPNVFPVVGSDTQKCID